jgi:hypothetical protein
MRGALDERTLLTMNVLFGRDVGAAHVSRGAGSPMAQHAWQIARAPTQPTKGSEAMDRSTERSASGNVTLTNEVEELLLGIKGLIFARAILEQRGASEVELEEHQREIERLRWRLASLIGDDLADSDTAA